MKNWNLMRFFFALMLILFWTNYIALQKKNKALYVLDPPVLLVLLLLCIKTASRERLKRIMFHSCRLITMKTEAITHNITTSSSSLNSPHLQLLILFFFISCDLHIFLLWEGVFIKKKYSMNLILNF